MTILVWICKFEKIAWFFLSAQKDWKVPADIEKEYLFRKLWLYKIDKNEKYEKYILKNIELNNRQGIHGLHRLTFRLERFSVRSRIGNSVILTNHQEEKSIDPCWRQKKRRNYLKIKYKSMNYRYRNYKTLGLPIEVSGFRDLSESNAAYDQEVSFLICPFCKISEPCSHCPE